MKILLTGATGFLGYRTLETLLENPKITKIVATGRNLTPERTLTHPKLSYKLGDLTQAEFVIKLVQGVDCIVNTAALSAPWGKTKDFYEANVLTQKNLVAAAQRCGVKRFVYVSTPSIYCNGNSRILVKEDAPLPKKFVNQYAATKRIAEIFLALSGIEHIILRPRAIVGRGDSVIMPRLIKAHETRKLRIIGDGKNMVDLTAVQNVVDAIVLSIFAPKKALNQTYNITNGTPVNLWNCIGDILQRLKMPLNTKKVPHWLASWIAAILELKAKATNYKEPKLTQYSVDTLAHSFTLDISKAQKLLDYAPKTSIEEAINEFVTWYKTHNAPKTNP